jgi:hypothetical protein
MSFNGCLDRCTHTLVAGWAMFPLDRARKATIEVYTGTRLLGQCLADQYRHDLAAAGLGDGCYAFNFEPPPDLTDADIQAIRAMILGSGYMFACGVPEPLLDVEIADIYQLDKTLPKRFKTCILHIGTEKTGSTTLQKFLHCNRTELEQRGYFLPLSLAPDPDNNGINHCYLPTLAMDDHQFGDDLRKAASIPDAKALLAYRQNIFSQFSREIERAPTTADKLVLSSEHCHSRLSSVQSIRHIKAFLNPFCESFRIIVYLRPQHEVAMSRYGMFLLAGMINLEMFPPLQPPPVYDKIINTPPGYYDYAGLLDRWAQVFGNGAIDPRLFGRSTLPNGNIIEDVLAALDLSSERLIIPSATNNNVSAAAQAFLLKLHTDPAAGTLSPEMLRAFSDILRTRYPGGGVPPLQHEAKTFFAQFAHGNEAVRARWFPHRTSLFDGNFPSSTKEKLPLSRREGDTFQKILEAVMAGKEKHSL